MLAPYTVHVEIGHDTKVTQQGMKRLIEVVEERVNSGASIASVEFVYTQDKKIQCAMLLVSKQHTDEALDNDKD